MALRVTGGEARGRRLKAPAGQGTRPTSDRVKEAIFNMLEVSIELRGARALDLYAGSGALGIEALSRGATDAVFVERAGASQRVIAQNLSLLGYARRGRLLRESVASALDRLARQGEPFNLVLADPPYRHPVAPLLQRLDQARLVAPDGLLVLEHSWGVSPADSCGGLQLRTRRRYGDTGVSIYEPAALAAIDP